MMTDKITPCDRISVPVYLTYRSENGVRAEQEMFAESKIICLRWYSDDGQMHQRITHRPCAWRDNKNYLDPDTRKWKYG